MMQTHTCSGSGAANLTYQFRNLALLAALFLMVVAGSVNTFAQSQPSAQSAGDVAIIEIQGTVEVASKSGVWSPAQTNQILHPFDRVRAGANSRVALRWSDQSVVSFGASSELEVLPPGSADDQAGLHLIRGIISFFHRDQPGHIHVITRGAVAGVEGTEFALSVDNADVSALSVIDGRVRFGNEQATLLLTNGEQAVVEPGKAPARTAGFSANNLLQWCFYYPAVLDPDELQLTSAEQAALAESLAAYSAGDLLAALAKYPAGSPHASDREKVYHAAVVLSVGDVAETEQVLSSVSDSSGQPGKLGMALKQLIAAVKHEPSAATAKPELASEMLAASYYQQSLAVRETSLQAALQLAKQATVVSPKFGFAWERVAELEFSFGHSRSALAALDKGLALAPRNAQALALKGFILAAQDQPRKAGDWFNRAIAADAALGNAWLGRGIVRIHLGDKSGGREDLLVAAALEPRRAEFRSYLGKSYAHTGDDQRAAKELALAKKLDPKDPTAWFYSALLNQQDSQINDAVRDLEQSKALNDNRSVYRSQLLLDEDQAVRSANLAGIYRDDGMFDQAMREAGRAVDSDYANYSAHLFLANSYEQLRDPNWSNLRYETPATSEFWIANLLAPTGAGWLSAIASEQPSAKLFDQNRVGVVSDTTYLDRGAWTEAGSQFGVSDKFSYNLEAKYIDDPGQRPNEDLEHRDLNVSLKYQLTPRDSLFVNVENDKLTYGNLNEYYLAPTNTGMIRNSQTQSPNVFVGYHHEWAPGIHTLLFASTSTGDSEAYVGQSDQPTAFFFNGYSAGVRELTDQNLVDISPRQNSVEAQQIWETASHTTVVGARYFWGTIDYHNIEWRPSSPIAPLFAGDLGSLDPDPRYPFKIADQNLSDKLSHVTGYGYHDWQVFDSLELFAGVAYDFLKQPAIVETVPFTAQEKSTSQVSPKAGFVWKPLPDTTFRAAYTRALSGYVNDSSIRLEPTEVAGFNQAFRSIIPDTVVGDTSGSHLQTFDVSLEQKFHTGTYLALSGEILYSRLTRIDGSYYIDGSDNSAQVYPYAKGLEHSLDYSEPSLTFTVDQLLGRQLAVGAKYRLSQARLDMNYPDILNLPPNSVDAPFQVHENLKSLLHTVTLHANWNHPSGWFAVFEADWYDQSNAGFTPAEPGDDFWQVNASVGFRFWRRRAEISAGILNLTDQSYQLEPLNLYNEIAQRRTFFTRLLISF